MNIRKTGPEYQAAVDAAEAMQGGLVIAVVRDGQFRGFHAVRSVVQTHGIRPEAWLVLDDGREWVYASGSKRELVP